MAKNKTIPKCPPLRFPQFNDEWKQTMLGEIGTYIRGLTYNSDDVQGSGYIVVRANNITEGKAINFDNELVQVRVPPSTQQMLMVNDIAICMANGSSHLVGKASYYNGNASGVCTVGAFCGIFRSTNPLTRWFFQTSIYNRYIYQSIQGGDGAIANLKGEDILKQIYSLPSLAEQKKIASFLSLIDERIQSCSETIKEIKTLKAGLLSLRVYQADKQYVPLSYFGEMKHGYPFKSTSYDEDGTHRIVTISNVSGARYADMSKCNYLAELPHDIQQHQILSRNDILISLTGNVGRVSFCLADGDLLNQRVGVLSLCDEAYKEYIYQVLSDWRFEMSMVACGQGAAQLNISKSNVEGYLVPYEQSEYQEIGNFFSLLDDRIEIEEELLKQYEMQKKYLLRQMFI